MSDPEKLQKLLDILWQRYKRRVSYAADYQRMVEERGGRLRNDHLAFRTFNCLTGSQPPGVTAIANVFEALGYARRDQYLFEDKHLTAWHWEHTTDAALPKIFISQLEVENLPADVRSRIEATVREAPYPYKPEMTAGQLAEIFTRPWQAPKRGDVEAVDKASQYGAWTLLHGNAVNHFTAYINEQDVAEWPDIEATVTALRAAGLPMKDEFEGERGSKLRQSSTRASEGEFDVTETDGKPGKMKWSYAYYELAERGSVPDATGKTVRFQGFLGAQATNLFEMTKRG